MTALRNSLRAFFRRAERALDAIFGSAWNPLYQLGGLSFLFLWVVVVSGIYLYIFFDTSAVGAYRSVEALTHGQWYLGGAMRSLHRYGSDALVVVMLVHLLREVALDRYRGARWFTWVTGVPILWLVFAAGINGYWLVWDRLAQYVAIASAEWLDWFPFFSEPIARNFLTPESLSDRLFTLLVFLHIALPLFLLLVLWIHLQRLSRPAINPRRGLALGTLAMLLALSFAVPAVSQGPVKLDLVPGTVRLDWFYLALYPLLDSWTAGAVWALVGGVTVILTVLPWLPPLRQAAPATVDLARCNGCRRCAADCPFNAITMRPRSDGRPFEEEAVVSEDLCVRCGICVGACPLATPFRRVADLASAIELPDRPLEGVRAELIEACGRLEGEQRVLVVGCAEGAAADAVPDASTAVLILPCVGMLPPAFIDFALSRHLAEGIVVAGCREGTCLYRQGLTWTQQRLDRERDPYLRKRVPRDRLRRLWASRSETAMLQAAVAELAGRLEPFTPDADRAAAGRRARGGADVQESAVPRV